MLGKLIKNEFRQSYRPMVLLYLMLVLITILATLTVFVDNYAPTLASNSFVSIIAGIIAAIFVISLVFFIAVGFIISCIRFYKTMFSEAGYLTHTLPVSPIATYFSKLLVSFIWLLFSLIILIMSIFMIVSASEQISPFKLLKEIINNWSEVSVRLSIIFSGYVGLSSGAFLGYLLSLMLIAVISSFTLVFFAMSLGQLSSRHKTGCSLLAGGGIYILKQIVNSIIISSLFSNYSISLISTTNPAYEFVKNLFNLSLILSLTGMALEITGSLIIIRKHLNLQ